MRHEQGQTSQDFEAWEENRQAIELFCMCPWRVLAGMSKAVFQGLDYPALRAIFDMMHVSKRLWPVIFADIRLIERGALEGLNG